MRELVMTFLTNLTIVLRKTKENARRPLHIDISSDQHPLAASEPQPPR
jgi:hypothetical protein